jgi:hypothetical protein
MRIVQSIRSLLFVFVMLAVSAASFAQIGVSITIGPPALPVYEQPPCPAEGYIWTPGYWAYGPDGYYWVPGTWVLAPQPGFLWTPGWWGWGGGVFIFHEGFWGPHVGFYGGINYGFGYFGNGYEGGRWQGDHFYYNRTVNNVNVTNIHNVYNTTVINNTTVNRVSYNGGNGGITARPTSQEETFARERHVPPVAAQTQHEQAARNDPQQRASVSQGKPAIAATARPGEFKGEGAVPAREAGAPYHPPAEHGGPEPGRPETNVPRPPGASEHGATEPGHPENNVPRPPAPSHAKDLQPHERPAPPNTGNSNLDQKYQKQQDKLYQKQEQDHQKLAQKQEQEHQQLTQKNADEARKQQVEQKHQQQTEQMEQKHTQQQQHMQQKQEPPKPK